MQLPSHSAHSPSTMAHRDPRSLASSYAYSCTRSSLPCAPSAHMPVRYSICRCSHSPPLPRCSDPVPADVNTSTSTTVLALTWTTTALYTLAMPLATTPLHGPDLHYDPPNIYAPATLALAAASSCTGKHSSRRPGIEMERNQNRGPGKRGNLCGITTAYLLSCLPLYYTTPDVMLGPLSKSPHSSRGYARLGRLPEDEGC
ncbi:hypothetical protein FIBSPDRAFT_398967 [Athelia psychrophila]|uniref:Uncharacterized protein n=1 Tax=Athelia psychrophila TaxID=1759441 RepID=A0A166NE62_9AGAM|nr:hypothetical protein FIBSPDRAFT_398967 [Fibularhizoctonia sp. CBS 109695]